jgi:hypothetical protein
MSGGVSTPWNTCSWKRSASASGEWKSSTNCAPPGSGTEVVVDDVVVDEVVVVDELVVVDEVDVVVDEVDVVVDEDVVGDEVDDVVGSLVVLGSSVVAGPVVVAASVVVGPVVAVVVVGSVATVGGTLDDVGGAVDGWVGAGVVVGDGQPAVTPDPDRSQSGPSESTDQDQVFCWSGTKGTNRSASPGNVHVWVLPLTVIVSVLTCHGSNSHAWTRMPVQSTLGWDMCAVSTPGATSWTTVATTSVDSAAMPSRCLVDTAGSSNQSATSPACSVKTSPTNKLIDLGPGPDAAATVDRRTSSRNRYMTRTKRTQDADERDAAP